MNKQKIVVALLVVSCVIVSVIFIGIFYYYQVNQKKIEQPISEADTILKNQEENDAKFDYISTSRFNENLNTYFNNGHSFYFDYPKSWVRDTSNENSAADSDLVFYVSFSDQETDAKIKCAINDDLSFESRNATPTQSTCDPLLSNMSSEQKELLIDQRYADNIYLRIYKYYNYKSMSESDIDKAISDFDLKKWLELKYRIPDTELFDYQVGPKITFGHIVDGYYSSTGCCGGFDQAYVARDGGLIYILGTNYYLTDKDKNIVLGADKMPESYQKIADSFYFMGE